MSLKHTNSYAATIGTMITLKGSAFFITTINNTYMEHGLTTYLKALTSSGSIKLYLWLFSIEVNSLKTQESLLFLKNTISQPFYSCWMIHKNLMTSNCSFSQRPKFSPQKMLMVFSDNAIGQMIISFRIRPLSSTSLTNWLAYLPNIKAIQKTNLSLDSSKINIIDLDSTKVLPSFLIKISTVFPWVVTLKPNLNLLALFSIKNPNLSLLITNHNKEKSSKSHLKKLS